MRLLSLCLCVVGVTWRRCVYSACRYARDPSLCKVRSAIVSSVLSESTFCIDELSEDDVFSERELYTGEARETAWKIMQNVHSKEARRFKRLQDEELSRMKARGEL